MTGPGEALRTARAHQDAGRFPEATAIYERILEADPDNILALGNLGLIALMAGQTEVAVSLIGRSVELNPYNPGSLNNMGEALRLTGRCEEALVHFQGAVALEPAFGQAHANLGRVFLELDRIDEALPHLRAVLSLDEANHEARTGLARVLSDRGDTDGTVAHLRRLLAADPEDAFAHFLLGATLLAGGRFAEGWPEYQWRLRHYDSLRPHLDFLDGLAPRWDGGPVDGRTLLLSGEQGLGDFIQFVRYVPAVAAAGARVVLHCPANLIPLVAPVPGIAEVVEAGSPVPPVDLQATLPSLPSLLLGRIGDTVPGDVPYLGVDEATVGEWRARMGNDGRRRIGICWRGNPNYWRNARKSMALRAFAPLAHRPGVRLFSLQGGRGDSPLDEASDYFSVDNLGPEVEGGPTGLLNTAAAMTAMDLVVTIDTSIAHLAGALGLPVWMPLATAPDWRWQHGRTDSPWYPTMRIFRQTADGDWDGVMRRIVDALDREVDGNP